MDVSCHHQHSRPLSLIHSFYKQHLCRLILKKKLESKLNSLIKLKNLNCNQGDEIFQITQIDLLIFSCCVTGIQLEEFVIKLTYSFELHSVFFWVFFFLSPEINKWIEGYHRRFLAEFDSQFSKYVTLATIWDKYRSIMNLKTTR